MDKSGQVWTMLSKSLRLSASNGMTNITEHTKKCVTDGQTNTLTSALLYRLIRIAASQCNRMFQSRFALNSTIGQKTVDPLALYTVASRLANFYILERGTARSGTLVFLSTSKFTCARHSSIHIKSRTPRGLLTASSNTQFICSGFR